jgi:hypothetical protein
VSQVIRQWAQINLFDFYPVVSTRSWGYPEKPARHGLRRLPVLKGWSREFRQLLTTGCGLQNDQGIGKYFPEARQNASG